MAKKMNVMDIMNIDLADLFINDRRLSEAVKSLLPESHLGKPEVGKTSKEEVARKSFRPKVSDVVKTYNQLVIWNRASAWLIEFRDMVINRGLTQLDWIALPSETVTVEMLKALGKEKLKKCSVILLDTLSGAMLKFLKDYLGKSAEEITIGELLNISREKCTTSVQNNFGPCMSSTWRKLLDIGFSYEDGVFLQEGVQHSYVEQLMKEYGLSYRDAMLVADIDRKRGWIKNADENV